MLEDGRPWQSAYFKAELKIAAFDGPASGASGGKTVPFNIYVDAAVAFEKAHGPFDVFVGHSLGGGVVAQLAKELPLDRRPQRMVVMAGFDESEHVFDRYQAMLGLNKRVREAFDRRLHRSLRSGLSVRDYSNTSALAQLSDVEGLVIHSRDDAISPYREGEALHAAWRGSQLLTFEEEGHGLIGDAPLDAIQDFVLHGSRQ